MIYTEQIVKATFFSRPNRFIAHVFVDGKDTVVHVPNTGRCKELLVEGCTVYLKKCNNEKRKTLYDLIAVEKQIKGVSVLINMDSLAPNKVAPQWITSHPEFFHKIVSIKNEYTYGDSRFDFYFEYEDKSGLLHKMFLEVKGVTLEVNGEAMFPDAPTLRGLKHIRELSLIQKSGEYECGILFVIQMKGCYCFRPNRQTQKEFADALKNAFCDGVKIFATDCVVTPDSLVCDKMVEVIL